MPSSLRLDSPHCLVGDMVGLQEDSPEGKKEGEEGMEEEDEDEDEVRALLVILLPTDSGSSF